MTDKFILEAEATWEISAGGEAIEPNIIVRVKDENGEPVAGLKKQDFHIYDFGFGFSNLNIYAFQEIKKTAPSSPFLEGTYLIRLKRLVGLTGQFGYVIIVTRKSRRKSDKSLAGGQTFVSAVKLK